MKTIKVQIKLTSEKENYLELKDIPGNNDSITIRQKKGEYLFQAGCKKMQDQINFKNTSTGDEYSVLWLTEEVVSYLMLDENLKSETLCLNAVIDKQLKKIELGPILGIFISKNKIDKLCNDNWDSIYWRFQKWSKEVNGLCYFFTLNDIDFSNKKVTGYHFDSNKKWVKNEYPLPRVIYDRCFGKDGRKDSYRLRKLVQQQANKMIVYNQAVKIKKKETLKHLYNYEDTKNHLPEFADYTDEKFEELLNKYGSIYLKPDSLYKARGIVQVIRKNNGYNLKYRESGDVDRNKTIHYKRFDSLIRKLEKELHLEDYLIQRDIQLASIWGNKFDIRVMLQKVSPYKWEVNGINCRIAPVNSIITSPRSGGKVMAIESVLKFAFPGREEELINLIEKVSKCIGSNLEKGFGYLGNIGVDLGIDTEGNVWLIEVNGKPLKVSFHRMKDRALTKRINKSPIISGLSLTGFDVTDDKSFIHPEKQDKFLFKEISHGSYEPHLFLNTEQLDYFGYSIGDEINLVAGVSKEIIKIKRQKVDDTFNNLYINASVFNGLNLPHNSILNLVALSYNELIFGPTVAMTVSEGTMDAIKNNEDIDLNKTAEFAREKGIVFYCFKPENVNLEENIIESCFYNHSNKRWEDGAFNEPQVLYDQATYPLNPEKRPVAKEVNRRLRMNHEMQVINSKRYFGKLNTFEALNFFKDIRDNMPKTYYLTPESLKKAVEKHGSVFVKSNYGSFGWGVIQVKKEEERLICRTGGSKVSTKEFRYYDMLFNFLREELGEGAIIQREVKLGQINNRKFDLRVLIQKNISSKWEISAVSFRIAPIEGIVTNVAVGGDEIIVSPGEKLPFKFLTWESISELSLKLVLALEASFGNLGEVGLDIGVGPKGKLWFFEANSKPDTGGYYEYLTESSLRKSLGLPLDYSKNLAYNMLKI
ncbi:YheC/YheD family protein [Natranaerofaba carboxydovora]|uniref:YheC/YheD family endospore coat-associated protein n=1 Tax=Natranaerofaba carboxydovora TaxID=2742683 RepID=UPI001F12BE8F|nr:YheC/YheD family protein [Natranaerofaba carboxydovora]UMZ73876.1 Endospore coat-associated protein YheD [Natranaerofaba carboxydovora]